MFYTTDNNMLMTVMMGPVMIKLDLRDQLFPCSYPPSKRMHLVLDTKIYKQVKLFDDDDDDDGIDDEEDAVGTNEDTNAQMKLFFAPPTRDFQALIVYLPGRHSKRACWTDAKSLPLI